MVESDDEDGEQISLMSLKEKAAAAKKAKKTLADAAAYRKKKL